MLRIAQKSDSPAIWSLLRCSFPPDELRDENDQAALLDDHRYQLFVTEDLQALISVWRFSDFSFIEHFAVAPSCRNQGLGSKLLKELLSTLSCRVCLEAELPETELAMRRLSFYERNGFTVNSFPYIQPSYSEGKRPVPMKLLTTGGPIDASQFSHIQNTLYQYVYNQQIEKAAGS